MATFMSDKQGESLSTTGETFVNIWEGVQQGTRLETASATRWGADYPLLIGQQTTILFPFSSSSISEKSWCTMKMNMICEKWNLPMHGISKKISNLKMIYLCTIQQKGYRKWEVFFCISLPLLQKSGNLLHSFMIVTILVAPYRQGKKEIGPCRYI